MTDRDQRFTDDQNQTPETIIQPNQANITPEPSHMERLKRMHLFTSFTENPANVYFQTQEPDEKVLVFIRKSQVINIPWILMSIGLALVPLVLFLFRAYFVNIFPAMQYIFVLFLFYYLLVATYAFVNFITWYYNAALITNKRVIDIDFHQLVFKDVAETKLALVQDVSYQQVGTLQNMFGYGAILIQTAGTLDNFQFYQLPQPARVVEIVESLIGGKRFYEP